MEGGLLVMSQRERLTSGYDVQGKGESDDYKG